MLFRTVFITKSGGIVLLLAFVKPLESANKYAFWFEIDVPSESSPHSNVSILNDTELDI